MVAGVYVIFKIIIQHHKKSVGRKEIKPLVLHQKEAENVPPRLQVACTLVISCLAEKTICTHGNPAALESVTLPLTLLNFLIFTLMASESTNGQWKGEKDSKTPILG